MRLAANETRHDSPQPNPKTALQENAEGAENFSKGKAHFDRVLGHFGLQTKDMLFVGDSLHERRDGFVPRFPLFRTGAPRRASSCFFQTVI